MIGICMRSALSRYLADKALLQVYIIFVLKEDPQSGNRLSSHTLSRERESTKIVLLRAEREARERARVYANSAIAILQSF
jgi:hypothetical protein